LSFSGAYTGLATGAGTNAWDAQKFLQARESLRLTLLSCNERFSNGHQASSKRK
jgi:hypothetical protein